MSQQAVALVFVVSNRDTKHSLAVSAGAEVAVGHMPLAKPHLAAIS
jgi:hypothetical protein